MKKEKRSEYKILIIEDMIDTQQGIVRMLKKLGYTVSGTAVSFEEAVEQSEKVFPDAIICDINIEGPIDGIMLAEELSKKADELDKDLAILFLTAYSDQRLVDRALQTRPGGYLMKSSLDDENTLDTNLRVAIGNAEGWMKHSYINGKQEIDILIRGMYNKIDLDSIFYVEANNNGCFIYTQEEILDVNQSFGKIIARLQPYGIQKVHRSFAVNVSRVRKYDKACTQIELNTKSLDPNLKKKVSSLIDVSATFRDELKEILAKNAIHKKF